MRLHQRRVSVAIVRCLLGLSATVLGIAPASADGAPADLKAFINAWRAAKGGGAWPAECDLNGDGVLDTRDAALLFETQRLAVPTGEQPFSVDAAELHADADNVDVVTSWQDHASDGGGTLDTTVSQAGAQVVVATDGQVRGLALSIPGAATPVRVDAESTALALAFLVPGIGASDPADAQARVAELKAMPEFAALVGVIRTGLAGGPLPTVTASDAYNAALQALAEAWITAHEPVATAGLTYDAGEAEFTVEPPTNPTKLANVHVKLRNDAWRYVHIVRRDLRADGSEIIHITVPGRDYVMAGAAPVTWSSMFSWTVGDPCFRDDFVNFTPERGCVRSQYWIVGPGLAAGDTCPDGVINSALELDAWGISVLHYVVLPQLELLTGTLNAAQASSLALRLWSIVKTGLDLRALANSSTQQELLGNTADIAVGVIRSIAESAGAMKLVGGNSYLLAFFLGGSAIFSTADCTMFSHAVRGLPRCTRLEVRNWAVSDNAPPSVKVTADVTHLADGQSTTLRWQTGNAATISSSNFGATTLSGKVVVKPAASTYYTMTVTGPGGTTTGGVWVYVGSDTGTGGLPHGMIDLGTLSWAASSAAYSINDAGQVVGESGTARGYGIAVLWEPSTHTMRELEAPPGGTRSCAASLTNTGQAVGWRNTTVGGFPHAVLWDTTTGTMRDLGTLGGLTSYASGVNGGGQVVGASRTAADISRAFLWDPSSGTMCDLGTLGRTVSWANAIGDAGNVVGWSDTSDGYHWHAFLCGPETGTMRDLGTLPGDTLSSASGINSAGQVVGWGEPEVGHSHAFLWDSATDTMRDLGTLGGGDSWACGINDAGQVVGYSYDGDGHSHAILWDPATGNMRDLGTLGGTESWALDINDAGQVVGYSTTADGHEHAFLWNP